MVIYGKIHGCVFLVISSVMKWSGVHHPKESTPDAAVTGPSIDIVEN
jgi:hypothetical protein